MDLACTCQVPHAQAPPVGSLLRPFRRRRLGRHHRPARNARGRSAQRGSRSARRAAGLPGALTALVRDLQVLDKDLPDTEHDFSVDVIITLPRSCRVARHEAHAACTWGHLDPAKISAIPALKNQLARPDKTARPRDANTQSGCQFASQRASPCAFLLRLVSPHPLFTLADASLTLPMGSQTDTSRRSIERLSGAAGARSAALRQRRLTQRRPLSG